MKLVVHVKRRLRAAGLFFPHPAVLRPARAAAAFERWGRQKALAAQLGPPSSERAGPGGGGGGSAGLAREVMTPGEI